MREVRPEVVHIDEEPYNVATAHAMFLARQHKARALFFTWQNLYRSYPPPFRQFELYNYTHAVAALAGNRDAEQVLRRKGYKGPVHVIPHLALIPISINVVRHVRSASLTIPLRLASLVVSKRKKACH